ncbi:hypothetical protein [Streptomyces cavernae]|nr:hypothetical protein [Streptomyces cavernae]
MTPPGLPRDGASPSPSTAKQKTERVVPLWEAARAHHLSSVVDDGGGAR